MATIAPAGLAAIGAKVDHPVGRGDDIEVVLDDHHGIAHVNQALEDGQQAVDVGEMKTRRGLIQDIKASAAGHPAKLRRELDSLGLAPGERGARLAEREIANAHVVQGVKTRQHARLRVEEGPRLIDAQLQDLADRLAFEPDFQGLTG